MDGTIRPKSLEVARTVAAAVRDAGGRALIVGGWVRDRLRRRAVQGHRPRGVRPRPGPARSAARRPLGRVEAVGQSFPVYKLIVPGGGDIDVALPRRESKQGRGHKGFVVEGDPSMSFVEAARRRDFTINAIALGSADRRVRGSLRRSRRPRARACCAWSTRARSATTVFACCARSSSRRASSSRSTTGHARCAAAIPLDDLPAERVWGEIEKLLLQARRPSIGLALALDLGVVDRLLPELRAAGRLRAGTRVAPGGRRLDAHADGGRPGACARSTTSIGRGRSR